MSKFSSVEEKFYEIRKYNYWDGDLPNTGFVRELYTRKISQYLGNRLVKVLNGQRRTGKSYVLRQLMEELLAQGKSPKNIFYINKEFLEFDFLKDYHQLNDLYNEYKKQIKPEGKVYLFIDEIQNISEWERFVNSKSQDFSDECEVFITGSNSKLLSGELASLLSGRYVQFEIMPFSYTEFLKINKNQNSKKQFIKYMQTGGLPELIWLPNDETKRHYVSSVVDTVLLRDIIQRYQIKNPELLRELFVYLVNNASNLVSINNIVKFYKGKSRRTTYDTIANYISFIEETYMMHRAERYDLRGKETIGGVYKFYANDAAYKNYLFGGFGYGFGYQLENLVYLMLRRNGFEVYVGNIMDKEIDFVAVKSGQTIYIQTAYSLTDTETSVREYGPLKMVADNYPKLVVTMDDLDAGDNEGIKHLRAWELEEYLDRLNF